MHFVLQHFGIALDYLTCERLCGNDRFLPHVERNGQKRSHVGNVPRHCTGNAVDALKHHESPCHLAILETALREPILMVLGVIAKIVHALAERLERRQELDGMRGIQSRSNADALVDHGLVQVELRCSLDQPFELVEAHGVLVGESVVVDVLDCGMGDLFRNLRIGRALRHLDAFDFRVEPIDELVSVRGYSRFGGVRLRRSDESERHDRGQGHRH